jgi:hypothetical protein
MKEPKVVAPKVDSRAHSVIERKFTTGDEMTAWIRHEAHKL